MFYRIKLIWAALFFNGKKLSPLFPKTNTIDVFGNANFFNYFPNIRHWNGSPPQYSIDLSRKEGTLYSTELDVIYLMYNLCRMINAKSVIEVGIYKGACSIALAQALADNGGGEIHCIDIYDTNFSMIKAAIVDPEKLVNLFFHHGDSISVVESGTLPQSDLIFIDADHQYGPVKKDVQKYWPLLAPGGILAMHDTIMHEGTRLVANELFQNEYKVMTLATSGGSGISLIFKEKSK